MTLPKNRKSPLMKSQSFIVYFLKSYYREKLEFSPIFGGMGENLHTFCFRFDFRALYAEFERNNLLNTSPIPDQVSINFFCLFGVYGLVR